MSFEDIINEIQINPVLWMSADPNYKDRTLKTKLWRELAMKLGLEEDVLKKKWKHLKDQYRKELKKFPKSKSGAEASDWTPSWKYYQFMGFMRHEVMPAPTSRNLDQLAVERIKKGLSNIWNLSNEEDSTDVDVERVDSFAASQPSPTPSTSQPTCISRKARKKGNLRKELIEIERKKIKIMEQRVKQSSEEENFRNDSDYLFLTSLLPCMKQLTPYQKLLFRGKINDWLLETQTPSQNPNTFYGNVPYYVQTGHGGSSYCVFPHSNTRNSS